MANQEQVALLKESVMQWNTWRKNNPTILPDLSNANLYGLHLNLADLSNTNLHGVLLSHASLSHANLYDAELRDAHLDHTDLRDADLRDAYLRDADLSDANLSFAHLSNAHFDNAGLSGADLTGAYLNRAMLNNANLYRANLTGAYLYDAYLCDARLNHVNFYHADLSLTNLSYARIENTSFGDRDLRVVKGLETVEHDGPSPLTINTIFLSQGDIPEKFVRGTGAPDSFLEYMKALASKPIEYYTCFISYSHHDEAFARRLHSDLQNNNVRCWFAPHDMRIGDEIRSRIDDSIRVHDKLLLILSQYSIESAWVQKEVETAFEKEQQQGKLVLFPVKLDDTIMQTNEAWAADIRRMRHIGDFQRWKDHDEYMQAFERLLRDLKADDNIKP